ncbi:adenine DNA glycosylase-like [Stegodyphus dumicola]|uniref:adenine DNA glycosylase-like n=1 Tax=Stegodyphus dumicola TaxID=202533 RepID=UPI0015AAE6B2|nr:adenine DNA glycosylase-like [Stegodyphus dumicola]XP_035208011.1 adenine DNA glycosylase-like [Stegodyphus dumicola]XP_035208012.1 adenine DNA glycosylase-like [Stegodyphus dumicola]
MKTVKKKSGVATESRNIICEKHYVTNADVKKIREELLKWYDKNQRVLPWRDIAKDEVDNNIRGYAVMVSEVMLQQTQVATVISYFNKWIKKWPTISSLAAAELEEVNQQWAGLGYYSRARRLHEGAKIIVEKLNGNIPQTAEELEKLIPGIGAYSAAAIASIAFQKASGVVDGNVIRVLSRMRVIGVHVSKPGVKDHLWDLANKLVSEERPGDFNQALMELGAEICTPQNPHCTDCSVKDFCQAYLKVKKSTKTGKLDSYLKKNSWTRGKVKPSTEDSVPDIENAADCYFCLPDSVWEENPQVVAYPPKAEKKKSRIEKLGVVVVEKGNKLLMMRRPEKGLLAGLLEFPSVIFPEDASVKEQSSAVDQVLIEISIPIALHSSRKYIGKVVHIFSHIRTTYIIEHLAVDKSVKVSHASKELMWLSEEEFQSAAVSTAMKKVLAFVRKSESSPKKQVSSKKRKLVAEDSKQRSIKSFFNK